MPRPRRSAPEPPPTDHGYTVEPREHDTPVLAHPAYTFPEVGSGKITETWHGEHTTICPTCGHRLVRATTPKGHAVVLDVTAPTWRMRLTAGRNGYLTERGSSYQEHQCARSTGKED
jgi:hypothetical protein